jgi:hypothetical protein
MICFQSPESVRSDGRRYSQGAPPRAAQVNGYAALGAGHLDGLRRAEDEWPNILFLPVDRHRDQRAISAFASHLLGHEHRSRLPKLARVRGARHLGSGPMQNPSENPNLPGILWV